MSREPATVRRSRARWALGLWCALAAIVFMVRFDWQTREVAHQFAAEQLARHEHGLPTTTINVGFRPRVGAEARRAGMWSGLIVIAGVTGTAWASRTEASRSRQALRRR